MQTKSRSYKDINLFHDMHPVQNFSKYSKKLDVFFKHKSFQTFFKRIHPHSTHHNHKHKHKRKSTSQQQHKPKTECTHEDIFMMSDSTKHNNNNNNNINTNKHCCYIIPNKERNNLSKIIRNTITPSVGHYNPNYNCIDKKSFYVDFSKFIPRKQFIPISNDIKIDSYSTLHNQLQHKQQTHRYFNTNKSSVLFHHVSRNTFNCSSTSYKTNTKHIKRDNMRRTIGDELFSKTQIVIDNNKHKHKGNNSMSIPITTKTKINYELYKHHVEKYHHPCVGFYNPNYDYITKHNPQICFNPNHNNNNNVQYDNKYKQMLIKKLWHSNANISSEYQLVNIQDN